MQIKQKHFGKYKKPLTGLPNLVGTQIESYKIFFEKGIKETFKDFSPIKDYSENKFHLEFLDLWIEKPKYDEHYAKQHKLSYDAPLKVRVKLKNLTIKEEKEQELFLADLPLMTDHGTFIINGVEKVVVPQLARSFGVFFTAVDLRGERRFGAKIIPARGAWIEIETDLDDVIYVRIDRKRKFPVSALLRVLNGGEHVTDEQIKAHFKEVKGSELYISNTLEKDHAKTGDAAFVEVYKKIRDSELVTIATAKNFIQELFSEAKYDLSDVGR